MIGSNNNSDIDDSSKAFNDFDFLFDNLKEVVWTISWPDLKVCFISKTVKDIIGYSAAEFKEDPMLFQKITHPDDKAINKKKLENLKETAFAEREFRIITKNNNIKWVHDKSKMVYDEDNNPIMVEGIMSDITRRKKAEEKLKNNEERYQEKNNLLNSVLESIQDGIAVLNPDLTIRYANPTMKKWFKNKSSLKGKKCFCGFYYKKDDCDDCPVQQSLKSGEMESTIKKLPADYEIDFVEIFSYPIYDQEKNKITGVVEFVKDISESLKQQKELEMMSFSINNADLLIFRVNPDGIIKYANETALEQLGYAKGELIGLKAENIIRNDYYMERKKYWNKLKSAGSLSYELSYLTTNKSYLPVEITSQYFKYQDKEYEFIFAQDITERIEKEKEIKYLAYRDSLTDLYNRKFFEAEMDRLDTERQLPISIIMGDLNGLKIINDSYGQKMGDQLLIKAAEMLKEVVREDDILARYGGDEFTILLPQTSNKTAKKIVKRIQHKSREQNVDEISLSISLGTATKLEKDKKITEIIKIAEDNMNQNKLSESRSSKSNIVQGLLNTLNAKSSETKEHALRMTKLAFDFGEKLELSTSELNRLSLLATLHDIGKTSIAETILKKPGSLNDTEWERIKEHPKRGYKIASASEEFALVADPILAHHEKWDGSGYPEGLRGEEIPYLARIITIIDSYDVMTNDRPYSKAVSQKEALAEIKSCAGGQFDPELANEFIKLIESE